MNIFYVFNLEKEPRAKNQEPVLFPFLRQKYTKPNKKKFFNQKITQSIA